MKKMFIFLIIGAISLLSLYKNQVHALENTKKYINDNGIEVTEKELEFINEFYGEDFFDNMTLDDYIWLQDLNINNSNVIVNELTSMISLDSMSHSSLVGLKSPSITTPAKKLTIAKSCSNVCTVIINNQWLVNPTIRSWDLIGARFVNTTFANTNITTKVVSSDGIQYSSNDKVYTYGLGTSVDLPDTATNMRVEQKFYTLPGGTIFGSYQHAMQNITLPISQSYVINYTGEGSVFAFYGNAIGKFDQMAGVSI